MEKHFPEGRKALEGGKQFKEVNLIPVNLLFTLLFLLLRFHQSFLPPSARSAQTPGSAASAAPRPGPGPRELRRGGNVETDNPDWNIPSASCQMPFETEMGMNLIPGAAEGLEGLGQGVCPWLWLGPVSCLWVLRITTKNQCQ